MLRVGRKAFSWNSTKFRMGGFPSERVTAIDFDEKINDELVRGNRRDGTPEDVTAGEYEPGMLTVKFLLGEWYGEPAKGVIGFAQRLSLGGTVGLSDVELDVSLQFYEELVGVGDIYFPRCRIVAPKDSHAKGTSASEIEIGVRVIDPIRRNGIALASVIRQITGA